MEGHGQSIEWVCSDSLVVEAHVNEKCFLVGKMVVIFHFVVDLDRVLFKFCWNLCLNWLRLNLLGIVRNRFILCSKELL